jgi:hypothetical protein
MRKPTETTRNISSVRLVFSIAVLMVVSYLIPSAIQGQFQSSQSTNPIPTGHGHTNGDLSSLSPDNGVQVLSAKQKQFILHSNFEKSKTDAAELAQLAKGLRQELDKPNANPLSAEAITRLEKIEKLAKKIREETKGF